MAACGVEPERMFKLKADAAGIEHTSGRRIGGQKPNAPVHGAEEQIGGRPSCPP